MENMMITGNKEVRVTSREIAEMTGKRHDNVMKDIRGEIETLENAGLKGLLKFELSTYINSQNKAQPCYSLTKKEALQIMTRYDAVARIKVLNHIEKLEEHINKPLSTLEMLQLQIQLAQEHENKINKNSLEITKLQNTMTIDYHQQQELRNLANKKCVKLLGGKESNAYKKLSKKVFSALWNSYKEYFRVASYKDTARLKFDKAVNYITNYSLDGGLLREVETLLEPQLKHYNIFDVE